MPEVSIIVPNYNHARFLIDRLESIFNQTFQDFEVILLDDASTDNSIEVLKKYAKHPKVSYFEVNEINSGSPFKQWDKGINHAKGNYIWIAESDDYCEPTFLEELLPNFIHEVVIVYSASKIINEYGEIIGFDPYLNGNYGDRWIHSFKNDGKNEIKHHLRYHNTIPNASSVIFKKELVNRLVFPTKMLFCGDWYLWIQILEKGDLFYFNKPLNYFRTHGESTRALKSIDLEIERFLEYFFVINYSGSLWDSLKNKSNFGWIVAEWEDKKGLFEISERIKILKKMPIQIKIHMKFISLMKIIENYKSRCSRLFFNV